MSWQRPEQKGWLAWLEGLPQIGHGTVFLSLMISAIAERFQEKVQTFPVRKGDNGQSLRPK
jgi:hypothetical protein